MVNFIAQDIYLRELAECDIENFIKLNKELRIGRLPFYEEIAKDIWQDMFNKTRVSFAVITEGSGEFCGFCAVKNIFVDKPEIEIELLRKYRCKGIGYQALSKMLSLLSEHEGISGFVAAVAPDNVISQRLMYKMGAVPGGIRKSIYMRDDYLNKFEEENMDMLNDQLIQVAKDFGVEPRRMLTHLLIFDIPLADSVTKNKVLS